MNVPNILTFIRLILIPVYAVVFGLGYVKVAFFVLLAAGITDVLDGHIARTRGMITELGTMLDPLADKLMLITVISSFLLSGLIPWTAAAAMFFRDACMIVGSAYFHFRGKKTVPANAMGKITTVLYYAAILFIVFEFPFAIPYLWFVIAFSFVTSILYIFSFRRLNGKRAHF